MNEPNQFHPLLKQQIKKHLPEKLYDTSIEDFLQEVNSAYLSNDECRIHWELAFPDTILHIDSSGKILDYKSEALNIAQLFPNQLIGCHVQDFIFLKIDVPMIKKVLKTTELFTFEHSIATQTKIIYIETRIKSLINDHAIIIIRDITERKKAEEELTNTKNYLETMLNSMLSGIIVIDAKNHEIVDVNNEGLRMIGAARE